MIARPLITTALLTSLFIPPCYGEDLSQPDNNGAEPGKVYRKYHPDGVVEFTDQPSRGSEELKIEELPTYKFAPATPTAPAQTTVPNTPQVAPRAKQSPAAEKTLGKIYTSLQITKPERNETIRSNSGDVEVAVILSPGLQFIHGHKLEYLLDGKSILKTEQATSLKNLDRGTHTLVIQVIDKNNKVLIHSNSVTFHLKRFFKAKPSSQRPTRPDPNNFDAEYDT